MLQFPVPPSQVVAVPVQCCERLGYRPAGISSHHARPAPLPQAFETNAPPRVLTTAFIAERVETGWFPAGLFAICAGFAAGKSIEFVPPVK